MQIRPGKTQSFFGGIAALLVTFVGLFMMSSFASIGGPVSMFMIIWVIFGLLGAGVSFYNAFSDRGVPLYEVKLTEKDEAGGSFCPTCGKSVGSTDRFCKYCGSQL